MGKEVFKRCAVVIILIRSSLKLSESQFVELAARRGGPASRLTNVEQEGYIK